MSALVGEAIKQCRAEELKLTETIRQYREILRSMKTRVKHSTEAEPTTSVKDHDIPLKERQEVELLEQVLEKALKVRSSSVVGSKYQEKPFSKGSASKAIAVKDRDKRNPQKLSSEVKESRQGAGQLKNTDGHGVGATRRVSGKTGPSSQPTVKVKQLGTNLTQKTTGTYVQRKPFQINSCSLESDRVMKHIGISSSEKGTSHLDQERKIQCEASAPEEQWVPSPLLSLWLAQRTKKNKLWTKVLTRHSKPVPERDHFKKRLISTFPTEWASVHMAAMEEQLGVLMQLGVDLTHCYNAELQRHQLGFSPEPSTEKDYESLLMLAGLEKMMVQVINEAGHLKKDWEKKMAQWRGSLCPLRSRIDWHCSEQPFLPPTIAYSSSGELEDLYSLRLQVAQLKLEIHMHQCMCDILSDLISCESSSSGRPSATLLRGVYSLLGEGGTQFPSLVLDIDLTQT